MTNRNREIETLFQRMGVTRSGPRDPAIDDEAARAVEQWPLLAMVTQGASRAGRRAPTLQSPATLEMLAALRTPVAAPTPVAVEIPAPTPVAPPPMPPVVDPVVAAAPEVPVIAAAPEAPVIASAPETPSVAPVMPRPAARLSQLEQLFQRAEQSGKAATSQASVFAPPPLKGSGEQPVAAQAPVFAPVPPPPLKIPPEKAPTIQATIFAPPPLKVPGEPRPAPSTEPAEATASDSTAEMSLTLEPKPRQWRELDTVPARLFERVGAR